MGKKNGRKKNYVDIMVSLYITNLSIPFLLVDASIGVTAVTFFFTVVVYSIVLSLVIVLYVRCHERTSNV